VFVWLGLAGCPVISIYPSKIWFHLLFVFSYLISIIIIIMIERCVSFVYEISSSRGYEERMEIYLLSIIAVLKERRNEGMCTSCSCCYNLREI